MKNKIRIILMIVGICLIAYPFISDLIYKNNQTTVINNYKTEIVNMNVEEKEEIETKYEQYNKDIYKNATSEIDLHKLGEIIGYIEIPKINIKVPIYEGLENNTLMNGVGHIEKTSLPGMKNTHTVLAAHSGLSNAKYFDELDKLELGDTFKITVLDNEYEYKVDEIRTVEKEHIEEWKIVKDKEYVTLITCVPLFINSHRLLVRGERINNLSSEINYEEKIVPQEAENQYVGTNLDLERGIIVAFTLFIAVLTAIIIKNYIHKTK